MSTDSDQYMKHNSINHNAVSVIKTESYNKEKILESLHQAICAIGYRLPEKQTVL